MTLACLFADNDLVKHSLGISSRSTTISAVGVLTLATMMSMAALGSSGGLSALALVSSYSSTQQGVRTAGDEEMLNWISCLTQAAKSLRGGPRLPEHLSAAVALPSLQASAPFIASPAGMLASQDDRLPFSGPTLQSHLINLPPPTSM